ncbi:hypothetical protein SCHPADRAFT_822533, partial [Schizopora paradoxa]
MKRKSIPLTIPDPGALPGETAEQVEDSNIPEDEGLSPNPTPPEHDAPAAEDSDGSLLTEPKFTKHPKSPSEFGRGNTILEQIDIDDPVSAEKRRSNPYFPFFGKDDWEISSWLASSRSSMAEIDELLHFDFVSQNKVLSSVSAKDLYLRIAQLPQPPVWKERIVAVEGGTTATPIKLLYRDGIDAYRFVFGNPIFKGHQNIRPMRVHLDRDGKVQAFNEPTTGDLAWELQDKIGEGETLGLVILGSDEAQLTKYCGDKHTHGIYLTCGNISKDIRTKVSSGCWLKVAEIPVVKFEEEGVQGILTQRLCHICLDIVTESLKRCAKQAVSMCDAEGILRMVRTMLLAYIADYPEQQLIACVKKNVSPISVASYKTYGWAARQRLRSGASTLKRIRAVLMRKNIVATNIKRYHKVALDFSLNGVTKPFWRDWENADPSRFLAPDFLHQLHIFFNDHVLDWAKSLVNEKELDRRFMALQKRVGFKHYAQGFSRFKQHTGRDHRDIERSFVGVIRGHPMVTRRIMKAFSSIMEVIFLAQLENPTTISLNLLAKSLRNFHSVKYSLTDTGLRGGTNQNGKFHIPKLELMQHLVPFTRELGSLEQYSTEQIERLHIDMAKDPYRATNKKGDYEEQICRFLDRQEKIRLFNIY